MPFQELNRDEINRRAEKARDMLGKCAICPHGCGVNRLAGETGFCRAGGRAVTAEVMRFLAEEVSPDTFVNVMAQYHPAHRALKHPELSRRVTGRECREAVKSAREAGLHRFAE